MPAKNPMITGKDVYGLQELFTNEELSQFLGKDAWLVDLQGGHLAVGQATQPHCAGTGDGQGEPQCQECVAESTKIGVFRCKQDGHECWYEPIRVGGRLVGFVAQEKPDGAARRKRIHDKASLLSSAARSRWRERIVGDAILSLSTCSTERAAFDVTGRAASLLFGPGTSAHVYDSPIAGTIALRWTQSDTISFSDHPPDPSHVGHVIATMKTSIYEPDVRNPNHRHLRFTFPPNDQATRTAFTLYLPMTEGHRGALQVISTAVDAFPEPERAALATIANVLSVTLQRLAAAELESVSSAASDAWRKTVLDVLLDDSAGYTLRARRDLYEAVALECQRLVNGYNAAVRLWDPSAQRLWLVASVGEGWTPDLKSGIFQSNKSSIGIDAIRLGRMNYVRDYDERPEYVRFFAGIESNCAIPFKQNDHFVGVISIAWKTKDPLGEESQANLQALVRTFERVLVKLAEKEDLAFHELLDPVATGEQAQLFEQRFAERLSAMFETRGCSLFLRLPGEDILRLEASTQTSPRLITYELGAGLVGECARDKRSRLFDELLLAPVVDGSRCVGVIELDKKITGAPFAHEEQTILTEIGRRLGMALESFWRNELARERERMLRRLMAVHHADLTTLTTSIADHAKTFTKASAARLVVWDRPDGHISEAGSLQLFDDDETVSWVDLVHRYSKILRLKPDSNTEIEGEGSQITWTDKPHQSALWAPFKTSDARDVPGLEGVLLLAWDYPDGPLKSGYEIAHLLTWIQSILPAAFRLQRVIRELETLRIIGLRVASDELRTLMKDILRECIRWSGMEDGSIRVYEPTRDTWVGLAVSRDISEFPVDLANHPFLERTRTLEEPIRFLPDLESNADWNEYVATLDDEDAHTHFLTLKSLVHIRIVLDGQCVGYIGLGSSRAREISRDEASYLQIHASYCALAIDLETKRKKLEAERNLSTPLALFGAMLGGFLHEFRGAFQKLGTIAFAIGDMAEDTDLVQRGAAQMKGVLRHLTAVCRDLDILSEQNIARGENIIVRDLLERVFLSHPPGVEVEVVAADAGPIAVSGNPVQIEMAFRMLYDNAREAMPEGGRVRVHWWREGPFVTVTVADTGIGMDAETLEKCWTPHFSTKRNSEGLQVGTGMGLSVVKGIVSRHGGRIGVTSSKGLGTTFTVQFPIVKV